MTQRSVRIAILVLLATGWTIAATVDLTGTWLFDVKLDAGAGTPVVKLKQAGNTLTGTYSGQLGEAPIQGTVEGSKVEFGFEAGGSRVIYKGEVLNADEMKGTADYAGQASGTWTAKRQK